MMLVMSCCPIVEAYSNPTVYLNGNQLYFDVPAQIINGRAMVPMRTIFEALGASVYWDNGNKKVIATKNSINLQMQIGSNVYYLNDVAKVCNPEIRMIAGRTMVPLRIVAESLQCKVDYDVNTNCVMLDSGPRAVLPPVPEPEISNPEPPPIPDPVLPPPVPEPEVINPEPPPIPEPVVPQNPEDTFYGANIVVNNIGNVIIGDTTSLSAEMQINEVTAGSLVAGRFIKLELPGGVKMVNMPSVSISQGDLQLGSPYLENGGAQLIIPIQSFSTNYSTIVISGFTLHLERTVSEGQILVYIGGTAGAEGRVILGNSVTPAP